MTCATMGEFFAWTVWWVVVMECAIAAAAVSVGRSRSGTFLEAFLGVSLPPWLRAGPVAPDGAKGGLVNLPAWTIALLVTRLLMVGRRECTRFNAVLVATKVSALTAVIALPLPRTDVDQFNPLLPAGIFGGLGGGVGAVGAAATKFFAYVGFDADSTAAEEMHNPQ